MKKMRNDDKMFGDKAKTFDDAIALDVGFDMLNAKGRKAKKHLLRDLWR